MLLVGLTGGIGSGKSTVAAMLEKRGAVVIDADDLARRAVEPGTTGYWQVLETFGKGATASSGEVDRKRLAQIVFADEEARRKLESIVHPEVARLFSEAVEADRGMRPEDVQNRMSAQLSDDERERAAHIVIANDGTLEELERVVDDLWSDLLQRVEAQG